MEKVKKHFFVSQILDRTTSFFQYYLQQIRGPMADKVFFPAPFDCGTIFNMIVKTIVLIYIEINLNNLSINKPSKIILNLTWKVNEIGPKI